MGAVYLLQTTHPVIDAVEGEFASRGVPNQPCRYPEQRERW
jgi:hypothetical protein